MPGFPDGHFYSPVIDVADLSRRKEAIWPGLPSLPAGVDLNPESQRLFLAQAQAVAGDYDYPLSGSVDSSPQQFCEPNGLFESLDARALYCMLRMRVPAKMIEVGSGYSSLLAADVNKRWLGGKTEIVCIEPYPPDFFTPLPQGIGQLIPERAEAVGIEPFLGLNRGDILFIDSSHVSKTGSDVNFLYLEVLPRLAPGVVIHVHDIFMPAEYPQGWVLEEQRSWNEQYLLQALLMYSSAFRVIFGSHFAQLYLAKEVEETFGGPQGGGSFWFEKTA